MKRPACVLTVAGSDSGAGAGIQADARTIHALGGYALTVVTALTAQNTRGVQRWSAVGSLMLEAQLASVFDDFPIRAIKTGLLPGAAAIRRLAAAVARAPGVPLVIDPVLGSTSGTRFLSPRAVDTLKRDLFPLATLITPNWPEAAVLAGRSVQTCAEAEAAARELAHRHGCAVLVKGGHGTDPICRDCLALPAGAVRWFSSRRVATRNTHGTGCVLSAAIATGLARAMPLESAIRAARTFLQRSLRTHRRVSWGGAGPAFPG